jgi:polyhydroxybutyrate depolymerase
LAYYGIQGGGPSQWRRAGDGLNLTGLDTTELVLDFLSQQPDWNSTQPFVPSSALRSFVYYLPSSYDPTRPRPLVLLLHGRSGTGVSMAFTTQMNVWAEREGFAVVYPDGLERQWNYIDGLPAYPDQGYNDADFLAQLLEDLSADVAFDPQRVYVGGFSNGGFMAQYLACTDRERYAAFASVGASAFGGIWELCQGIEPAPMLFIHGLEDAIIPWEGRRQGQAWLTLSVNDTIGFWAATNTCSETFESEELPALSPTDPPATRTGIMRLTGCPPGAEIVLYGVIGGGHNWPGNPEGVPPEIGGVVSNDFYASEVLWQFFAAH